MSKKEAKKLEVSNEDIVNKLGELSKAVADITERLNTPNVPTVAVVEKNLLPVPTEYREIVNSTLNKKFGIEIAYPSDTASFEFSILVPKEYSNAGLPHWETHKEDRRSRVIINALGVNGVREWATKVYENFSNETRSQIAFDRAQP